MPIEALVLLLSVALVLGALLPWRAVFYTGVVGFLVASVLHIASAATVVVNGATCPLAGAEYGLDRKLTLYACGTVFFGDPAGLDYSKAGVLSVPAVVKVDRIFSNSF